MSMNFGKVLFNFMLVKVFVFDHQI